MRAPSRLGIFCLLSLASSLASPNATFADSKACPDATAQQAESAADKIQSWQDIRQFYKKYRACDDGGIADSFTEGVVRLLSSQADGFHELADLQKHSPEIFRFTLKHIDSTADAADLDKIKSQAAHACSPDAASVCKSLAQKISAAQKD